MSAYTFLFLSKFGPVEIILIVVVILLLFGGKKIPELMKGLGKGMTEFKKARAEDPSNEKKEEQQ